MKITRHIIFWIVVILILTFLFGDNFGSSLYSFYFISMLLPIIGGTFYFLNYYLIPRYFNTDRYLKFALYFFYTIVVSLYLAILVMLLSFMFFAEYNIGRMNPYSSDVVILGMVMYIIVFGGLIGSMLFQLRTRQQMIREMDKELKRKEKGFVEVRADRKKTRVSFESIMFIESLADYIKIHVDPGDPIITREKISHIEKSLPDEFLRIHRSFIVNTGKINSFDSENVYLGETELPISRTYRKEARIRFNKKNLP